MTLNSSIFSTNTFQISFYGNRSYHTNNNRAFHISEIIRTYRCCWIINFCLYKYISLHYCKKNIQSGNTYYGIISWTLVKIRENSSVRSTMEISYIFICSVSTRWVIIILKIKQLYFLFNFFESSFLLLVFMLYVPILQLPSIYQE